MGLVDYPKLIKEPMDLGTVSDRVGKSYYGRLEEFACDVRLVWVMPPPTRKDQHAFLTFHPNNTLSRSAGLNMGAEECVHLQRPRLPIF